jgi:hypothetical protein
MPTRSFNADSDWPQRVAQMRHELLEIRTADDPMQLLVGYRPTTTFKEGVKCLC